MNYTVNALPPRENNKARPGDFLEVGDASGSGKVPATAEALGGLPSINPTVEGQITVGTTPVTPGGTAPVQLPLEGGRLARLSDIPAVPPAPEPATTTSAGLMAAADKVKLDGLLPAAPIEPATTTSAGLMAAADKVKLDGLTNGMPDGNKGDVTVGASGTTLTLNNAAVTNAKLASVVTATIKGRTTAGTGAVEDLTPAQVANLLPTATTTVKGLMASADKTKLDGLTNGIPDGDKGDVTVGAGGTTLAVNPAAITNVKLAAVATTTIKGRTSAGTGVVEDLTPAQAANLLPTATTTVKGLMAAADKVKLDGLSATGVTDGVKGDIAVSAAGAAFTIQPGVVTNTKLATVATATIKGRTAAGAGVVEDLTPAQVATMLPAATAGAAGTMSAADKTKLTALTNLTIRRDGVDYNVNATTINLVGAGFQVSNAGNTVTIEAVSQVSSPLAVFDVYVHSTGVDSNPGTEAQPVLTLQQAFRLIDAQRLRSDAAVTIFLFPGDTVAAGNITFAWAGAVTLDGRKGFELWQRTTIGPTVFTVMKGHVIIKNVDIHFVRAPRLTSFIAIGDNVTSVGSDAGLALFFAEDGGQIWITGTNVDVCRDNVDRLAGWVFYALNGGYIRVSSAIGWKDKITITIATVAAINNSLITFAPYFTRVLWNTGGGYDVVGKRYDVWNNSTIYTATGGATYIPGSIAGTAATDGLYN